MDRLCEASGAEPPREALTAAAFLRRRGVTYPLVEKLVGEDEAEIAQDELSLLEGEVSETESELTKLKIALAEKEGERDGQENLIKHSQRQLKNLDSEIIQKEEAIEGIKYKIKNFNIEEETEKLIRKAEEEKAGLENVIDKLKEEESSLKIKIKEASEEKNQLLDSRKSYD